MDNTLDLSEAILWGALSSMLFYWFWAHRAARLGAHLRIGLGAILAAGVMLCANKFAMGVDAESLSTTAIKVARIAVPAGLLILWISLRYRLRRV